MSECITLYSNIMVIDDSLFILKAIEEMLKGSYSVKTAISAEMAYELLEKQIPDLILLDLEMPGTNGFQFLERVKQNPAWQDIPVIFLTSINDRAKEEMALEMGAVDYILKPIFEGVLKKRIGLHLELRAYQKKLESLVDIKTKQLQRSQDMILDILANLTTYRDNDTGSHIIRTTSYITYIVELLQEIKHPSYTLDPIYAQNIMKASKLHDIGKIGIADGILLKTSRFSVFEYEIIKMHTLLGAQILDNPIVMMGDDSGFLSTAREIIMFHHEWWNGAGYPDGLKGEAIPVSARIMAVADVYDALISKRSYKRALSHEEALSILKSESGAHFDPILVDLIEPIYPKFKEISDAYQDD